MYRNLTSLFLTASFLFFSSNPVTADSIGESIKNGTTSLNIRYRIETVEQDNARQDATASTVRTRLGYTTAPLNNLSVHVDFEDVHVFLADDYDGRVNGNTAHSVVADPVGTELNQAYLNFQTENNKIKIGRQRLILDNARFIGNVGWRQNEQTYDGLSFQNTSLPDTTITYASINNVNRIFFDDLNMSNQLLNVLYQGIPDSKLSFYGYYLEFDEAAAADNSHKTFGVRYSTKINRFLLTAELASQSEYQNGLERDVDYRLLEMGYAFTEKSSLKFGLETLGSKDGQSFQTPLATLHAFSGWADLFLTTPAAGLEDTYISYSKKFKKVKLAAVYHNFQANTGGADYGTEIDFLAGISFKNGFSGGVKLARYDADTHAVDTNKFWLWLQYSM